MIKKLKIRKKHRDTYFFEIYSKINELIDDINKRR